MTDSEQKIIDVVRELKPYETVTIQKDQNGKPDYFIIKREQKIFLNSIAINTSFGL